MTILWLLDIDARYGQRHGATIRYTNLSRGLVAAGHRVYYALNNQSGIDQEARNHYLESLREDGCFTDYFEIEPPVYSATHAKLKRVLVHPWARDAGLKRSRWEYINDFRQMISKCRPDVCILSDRDSFFLAPEIHKFVPTVIDFGDSYTIVALREARLLLRSGEIRGLLASLKVLVRAASEEHYYGKYAIANIVVSPGDKRSLDILNRRPERNRVLRNGVSSSAFAEVDRQPPLPKDPNTLIFTGSMGFPPNYQGALWFIDRVMPLLIRRNPDIRLTIAGQEPGPALLAKAGRHVEVTGLVPDLLGKIARAQLFVAPLISGTGFRNKVVEALASGTYVIGTPMALEFLDDRLRAKLLTAPTPAAFADQILRFLQNPADFDERLHEAIQIVRREYSWAVRIGEFEELCRAAASEGKQRKANG